MSKTLMSPLQGAIRIDQEVEQQSVQLHESGDKAAIKKGLSFSGLLGAANMGKIVGKAVAGTGTALVSGMSELSYADLTKATMIRPVVGFDTSIKDPDIRSMILSNLTNMMAGQYMQSIEMLNNIGNITVLDRLQNLNPNYAAGSSIEDTAKIIAGLRGKVGIESEISLEAAEFPTNMCGKSFEVTIMNSTSKGDIVKVPMTVTVALDVKELPSDVCQACLTVDSVEDLGKMRYYRMRAGELSFIWDILFCRDLIGKRTAALAKDKTGFYRDILERRDKTKIKRMGQSIVNGSNVTMSANNIMVISSETAEQVEYTIGSLFSDRDKYSKSIVYKMFFEAALIFLVIVDQNNETIKLYVRGDSSPVVWTYNDLMNKSKNSAGGVDPMVVMNALLSNKNRF